MFDDEISRYTQRLVRRSFEPHEQDDDTQRMVDAIASLAHKMKARIIQGMIANADSWALREGEVPLGDELSCVTSTFVNKDAETHAANLAESIRALEEDLKAKRALENQLTQEIVDKLAMEQELRLTDSEHQLCRMRAEATQCDHTADESEAKQIDATRREYIQFAQQMHASIAEAKDAMARLEAQRCNLSKIERQQNLGIADAEAYLLPSLDEEEDEADRWLWDVIQSSERISQRMKVHRGASAA